MSIAIKVENLSKAYQIGEFSTGTISQDLERWWAIFRGKEDPFLKIGEENVRANVGKSNIVWSLKDLNFEIAQGSVVGIIGKNGAGKSTLLKILSQVTAPTTGKVKVKGRIASLLEVGTGFHPELTGRENIFINGALLGMKKHEILAKFDEIVAFSGVDRYIDTPVKRYSSGMYVRLAFAIAAHLESEILIVDEVLAVGDAEFQKKCLGKMGEISDSEGRTVLFVSHNMNSIKELCKRSIILENGRLLIEGPTRKIISQYYSNNTNITSNFIGLLDSEKKIWFKSIEVKNANKQLENDFNYDESIHIDFEFGFNIPKIGHNYSLFIIILDQFKNRVFSAESEVISEESIFFKIPPVTLVRGDYTIHTFIHQATVEQLDVVEDVCAFKVIDNGSPFKIHSNYDYGNVFIKSEWTKS